MSNTNLPTIGSVVILDTKTLTRRVGEVARSSRTLTANMHMIAVNLLWHAAESGDITLANKFMAGLGKGVRSDRLLAWLCHYGPIRVKDKDAGTLGLKKGWKREDFRVEEGEADPWPTFEIPGKGPTTQGADKLFAELNKWAENKARKDSDVARYSDDGQKLAKALLSMIADNAELAVLVAKASK